MNKQEFISDFKARIAATKTTRWVRFGLVALLYLLWVIWMGSWWLLIFLPLLFDIYITGYIPFTWWKKSKSKTVRTIMSWVDAIVYALVLVYFIFTFVGQNYMIPSQSLEKTLLTGDYLWVNKMVYGPRVPITPIHFPLVHNTMPLIGTDSYTSWPENSYRRLKGLRGVELGDIVVFNFPAGDTVATKFEEQACYYDLVRQYGWEAVNTNEATFGKVRYRPVDRRTNYVKRAVGLPGQRFRISGDTIYLDGKPQPFPQKSQFLYIVEANTTFGPALLDELGLSEKDIWVCSNPTTLSDLVNQLGFQPTSVKYEVFLTADMIKTLQSRGLINKIIKVNDYFSKDQGVMYPGSDVSATWTVSDWGGSQGVVIPKKGMTINLTPENWQLYNRVIRNYERHHDAYMRDGKVYIGGKEAPTYTFEMDYYMMMGDNRDNSLDSRYWGFVPEDHIVGTPAIVLISFDQDHGGIRWNRILRDANPDK